MQGTCQHMSGPADARALEPLPSIHKLTAFADYSQVDVLCGWCKFVNFVPE
jgi:hypothetical protein